MRRAWSLVAICLLSASAGCGTTKWSDTPRTATEQLLISDAVDRAVSEIDFTMLANRSVFFDATFLKGAVDENYVVSSLRQHLLASGCLLMETRELADYVVEARAGAVGTDRSDLLFGVPSVTVPTVPGMPMAMPSSIPEIPLAKTTNQKAVAKLAVFAYNRKTGRPVLQSGVDPAVSTARNSWLFGAGPFRNGTVYAQHHELDGGVDIPIIGGRERGDDYSREILPVTASAIFPEPATEPAPPESQPSAPQLASPTPLPAAAGNQMARLPVTDQSQLTPAPGAPAPAAPPGDNAPNGTPPAQPDTGVRRAQFTEPAAPPSLPRAIRSSSSKGMGEASTSSGSKWGMLWPGNWFGDD